MTVSITFTLKSCPWVIVMMLSSLFFLFFFMHEWILLPQPGVNVQLKASAMCSKVNQALALYTEGPVIFIMFNNTLSWELISFHIPGQLLVSIIVYLSRGKINQNALGPPRSGPATLTGLFEQREVLSYDK